MSIFKSVECTAKGQAKFRNFTLIELLVSATC